MREIFALILFTFPLVALSQNINKSKIAARNFCDTIPFEYTRGKMVIQAIVNDQQKRFILDTGAPLLISEELQGSVKAQVSGSGNVTDVAGNTIEQPIVTVPEIRIGNIAFQDAAAIVFSREKAGLLDCFEVDGLIGSTLLKHCIVQIDTDKKIVILTDKLSKLNLAGATKTRMKLDANSRPFVRVDLGEQGSLTALFDSGSDKFLPLSKEGYDRLNSRKELKIISEGYGSISSGLYGPGRAGEEKRVAAGDVFFGDAVMKDVVASVSEHKNKNAIGMGLAEYGAVTLDYLHRQFYFVPKAKAQVFRPSSFFGFHAQVINGVYTVSAVYKSTEAEKLGLRNGCRIMKINDFDLSGNQMDAICRFFLSGDMEGDTLKITFTDSSGKINSGEIRKEIN